MHSPCEKRRNKPKIRAFRVEQDKMPERNERTAPAGKFRWVWFCSSRADANPIHLIADSLCFGLAADAADTNDCIETSLPESSHAVPYPKASRSIRIALVRPLVD
jgi:hypothetical protein